VGDFTVRLPLDAIHICGNMSTDDHGVVSYRWRQIEQTDNTATTDIQGADKSVLKLTNTQPGTFVFELTVTDTGEQTDTHRIALIVLPAQNQRPIANAGPNAVHELNGAPNQANSVFLDASASTDDGQIRAWRWMQTGYGRVAHSSMHMDMAKCRGPRNASLANANKMKATASGLNVEGVYTFMVNVTDDKGAWSNASMTVTVTRSRLLHN
jgi:hypothetical protein